MIYRQIITLLLSGIALLQVKASAASREPSLELNPSHQWQLAEPQNYSALEKFFSNHGNCRIELFGWFLFDLNTGMPIPTTEVMKRYPTLNTQPNDDCELHTNAEALSSTLALKNLPSSGPILIFFDFIAPKEIRQFVSQDSIAFNQAKIEALGRLNDIPKYFILTPSDGINRSKL